MQNTKILKKILLTVLLVLLQFIIINPAFALSCIALTSTQQAFVEVDAVFSGKIIEIGKSREDYNLAILEVTRSWKGVEGKSVVFDLNSYYWSYGGKEFQKGDELLIYALRNPNGTLELPMCGRMLRMQEAQRDLRYLNRGWLIIIGGLIFVSILTIIKRNHLKRVLFKRDKTLTV